MGATVEITNADTGFKATGVTTSVGRYVFDAVLPGNYTLTVTKTGFGTYTASGITIQIQQVPSVNVVLKPGSVTETLTVSSAVPLMQTQSAQVNQTITGQQINDLPMVARDWTTLGQLAAGVTTLAGDNTSDSRYIVNGQSFNQVDFRLNGIDDNVEMFPSPGAHKNSNAAIEPPPDAIQEFTLESGGFSAESGHSLGAVINAAVKTGTNHFHGDLWEYVRNKDFNANDYFNKQHGRPIPEYNQNQFGGTVGGPVVIPHLYNGHNKTFFFFDWQSTLIIAPGGGNATVPTANMVSSSFTNMQDLINLNGGTQKDALGRVFPTGTIFDPATTRSVAPGATDTSGITNTTGKTVYMRDPFYTGGSVTGITDFTSRASQLNMLPASRLDPNAVALLKLYPAATQSGIFANDYFRTTRNPNKDHQFDLRGDEQFNDRNSIFAVYSWDHNNFSSPSTLAGVVDGGGLTTTYPIWELAGGYNHTFTPTLLNVLTAGFNHAYELQGALGGATFSPQTFGITGIPSYPAIYGGTPDIGISGLTGMGPVNFEPTVHTLKALQLNDTLSWTRGRHSATFGVEGISISGTAQQPVYPLGNMNFSGQYSSVPNGSTSYTGMSDMLLSPIATSITTPPSGVAGISYNGGVSSYNGSNVSLMIYHRWYLASFAQDDWRVTPKLTLNLGVRWDYFGPQADVNGKYANMEFSGGNGPGGTFYLPNQTCGYPRSAAFNAFLAKDNIVVDCVGNDLQVAQHDNFSPRVGFADQLMPRFVLRGGYGIAFSSLEPRGTGQQLGQNYPFEYTVNSSNSNNATTSNYFSGTTTPITLENAIGSIGLTNPAGISGVGTSLYGSVYKFQTPYTETANLAVEFALTHTSTISAAYVGEFGRHLQIENVHNSPSQLVAKAGAITANYIPAPDFAANSIYQTTNGISSYHSLQTVYQLRNRSGDSILANYTFAKCMQDGNEFQYGVSSRAPWLPGFGIRAEYELCSADAKNVVHASGTYHIPLGKGRRWLADSNAAVNAVLGGWVANAIYTYQSGQPFTIGCPTTDFAFFGCNANLTGQPLYSGPHNVTAWLNRGAFTQPPTFAQVGPNLAVLGETGPQARGPSYVTTTASMFKEFEIHESVRVQFRAEAFNLFNQVAFGNPGQLDISNPVNFSQITSDRQISGTGARILQLALKLYY